MDNFVKAILHQWQLDELIPRFEDEEVNEKAFNCLTDDIIRELIPKLGKRAIFNKAYKAYREALDKDETLLAVVQQNNNCSPTSSTTTTVPVKVESNICIPPHHVPSENDIPLPADNLPAEHVKLEDIVHTSADTEALGAVQQVDSKAPSDDDHDSNPKSTPITFSICALENPSDEVRDAADSLRYLLTTSTTANRLLAKTFLKRSSRNVLAKEIVHYLWATNDGVLSNRLLQCWARAVQLVFKNEISDFYFRETEDGSVCRGRLAQLVKNYRYLKQTKRGL